jgi:hypothetical protein
VALPPRWKDFMVRLLLWVSAATAASKIARRCATSAARCAMNRRMSSGDTLVSHRSAARAVCQRRRAVWSQDI